MDQNPDITLSICIPTYNRAGYIAETVASIVSQAHGNVQIVIVDGASSDNTEEIVRGLQNRYSNIIYYRGYSNMGVDKDMAKAVELASGDYCWLLSSDDVLKPGAIERILREIQYGYDIYLCNMTGCSPSMTPTKDTYWLLPNVKDRVFNMSDRNQLLDYFHCANWLGALFSFMSSIIFYRNKWREVKYDYSIDGTCYGHVFRLFSFISLGCKLKYIREPLVFWRMENDCFSHVGFEKRMLLDVDGYLLFAQRLFPDDEQAKTSFLRVMKSEHPWYHIVVLRAFVRDDVAWNGIAAKLQMCGYNSNLIGLFNKMGRYRKLTLSALQLKETLAKRVVRPIRRLFHNIRRTYPFSSILKSWS